MTDKKLPTYKKGTILNLSNNTKEIHYINKPKYKPIRSKYPTEIYQIDLIDWGKTFGNNKLKYILTVVDVFSRNAGSIGITSKTANNVLEGYKKVIKQFFNDIEPTEINTDDGNEFRGSFDKYLNELGIIHIISTGDNKNRNFIVERFNGTLSYIIQRYLTENNTTQFVKEIPNFIKAYNSSFHTGINAIPSLVFEGRDIPTLKTDLSKLNTEEFNEGDKVRIKNIRKQFTKGKIQRYSTNVYTVMKQKGHRYKLKLNADDEDENGVYYPYHRLLKSKL